MLVFYSATCSHMYALRFCLSLVWLAWSIGVLAFLVLLCAHMGVKASIRPLVSGAVRPPLAGSHTLCQRRHHAAYAPQCLNIYFFLRVCKGEQKRAFTEGFSKRIHLQPAQRKQ